MRGDKTNDNKLDYLERVSKLKIDTRVKYVGNHSRGKTRGCTKMVLLRASHPTAVGSKHVENVTGTSVGTQTIDRRYNKLLDRICDNVSENQKLYLFTKINLSFKSDFMSKYNHKYW